jgi:hypothetical protein
MRIYLFSLLFLLLAACTATQPTTTPTPPPFRNVMISYGSVPGPHEPSICISPANTQHIVAGSNLDNCHVSEDGGKTWLTGGLGSKFGVWGDPCIVADSKGVFYYAHLSHLGSDDFPPSPPKLDRIVIQRSDDNGFKWSTGSFCGKNGHKVQDKEWLAIDPRTDALYCTWTEFDAYKTAAFKKDHSRILMSKSTNGGNNWSFPTQLSQFEGDCKDGDNTPEGAVPAIGPNGEVYVAWSWNEKIWFDRSFDGGKTWQDTDIIVADQPGGWSYYIPGLQRCNGMPITVCDRTGGPHNGTIYVNWSDQRNGLNDTDVFVAKSTDQGRSWSAPVRVNNDPAGKHQFMTWMALDPTTGYLYCVFYDRRAHPDAYTDVYLATSRDGGATFENTRISDSPFKPSSSVFFGDYNNISAHNGVIRPIWTRYDKKKGLSVWTALVNDER